MHKLHVCIDSNISCMDRLEGKRTTPMSPPAPRMIQVIVFDITCCPTSHPVFMTEQRKACQFADSLLLICAVRTLPCCVSCRACYGTQGGRVVSVNTMGSVHHATKVKLVHRKKLWEAGVCLCVCTPPDGCNETIFRGNCGKDSQ